MRKFRRMGEKIFELKIQGNDITKYAIIMHSKGSLKVPPILADSILKAGETLQSYIYKVTDVLIPIVYDIFPLAPSKLIAVGGTNCVFDVSKDIAFADDEYLIKTADGNLIINGGKRGVLYGVYEFLEKHLEIRFFTKDCEKIIDSNDVIEVGLIDDRYNPPFEYREICDWTAWNPDFSVKSRINGNFTRKLREEDGYSVGFSGGFDGLVHTFGPLLPPAKYYKDHPEFYALNEKDIRDPSGLCLSNGEMLSVFVKNAEKWLEREADPTIISVSVNDGNIAYCKCDKCAKIYNRGGNNTDALLVFVNNVARALKRNYPKIKIDTISYGAVSDIPVFEKPDDNVIIRVCATYRHRNKSIPQQLKDMEETPDKEKNLTYKFANRLKNLGKMTDKIYVWDYPYNYNIIPAIFPVMHTQLENYAFYADHNVKGIYINGETDVCEFTELKVYLFGKLMFFPKMDAGKYHEYLCEFLQGYYGSGWEYILQFIKLTESLTEDVPFTSTSEPYEIIPLKIDGDGNYDQSFIQQARLLFDKAYQKADGAGERRRVKRSSLQVDTYELFSLMEYKMLHSAEQEKQEYIQRNRELYNNFVNFGMTRIRENTFVPVVKNFAQPPLEWAYWDFECVTADRNNEKYERELYLLLPSDLPLGAVSDVSFMARTNNENKYGNLGLFNGKTIVDTDVNPKWEQGVKYQKLQLSGAIITTTNAFLKTIGENHDDLRFNFLPIHLKGVILRVKRMDAGAYLSIKDVTFLRR